MLSLVLLFVPNSNFVYLWIQKNRHDKFIDLFAVILTGLPIADWRNQIVDMEFEIHKK